MRHKLIAAIAVTGLLLAGCGEEDVESIDQARTDAEQIAGEGSEQANDLLRETQGVAEDVAAAARDLAEDPQADVDTQLEDAEQRARDLADRAENELPAGQEDVASAISSANEQLAQAAADLREEDPAATAERVIQEDLPQVARSLGDAARAQGDAAAGDAQQRIDELREEIDQLGDQIPGSGG